MRYLIAGGGTGGHIIPALNIATALQRLDPEAGFMFLGTQRGLEKDIIPKRGFDIEFIDAAPWEGIKRSLKNLRHAIKQTKAVISGFHPHCIIGTGGYVSAPAALAAKLTKTPLFWQEQNTYPGLATKLASLFAKRIFLGFIEAREGLWRKKNAVHTGNPVEMGFARTDPAKARKVFGLAPNAPTILLTGGSQGAAAMNEVFWEMLNERGLPARRQAIWQCGSREFDALEDKIGSLDARISLHSFIEDMGAAYSASELVICRAGASTLAEIAVIGTPAILVPYPHAAKDHQRKNALTFVRNGAAIILEQCDITPALLFATIEESIGDHSRHRQMSQAMKSLGRPEATENIAREIVNLL